MKHRMLIVGDDLRVNKEHLSYIYDSYEEHFGEVGDINFVSKSDNEILFIVENLIKDQDSLCIFASDESYDFMAKILATLSSDVLELTEQNTIATKNALDSSNGSFVIELNNTKINLIQANPTEKMAEILIKKPENISFFNLFDIDKESAKILLEPLAKPYKVQIYLSEILPNLTIVKTRAEKFGSIDGFKQSVKNLFSQKMIDDKDIVKFIAKKLIEKDIKISFAESCTAGMCASRLGNYDGVSGVFEGSIVSYANRIKNSWLGVSDEVLDTYGAVSEECVRAMLSGVIRSSESDFSIAISGIAGPNGGSDSKPVGTVFVGVLHKDGTSMVERLLLKGDRNYIREQSMLSAFLMVIKLKPDMFLGK
ncbi:competence/damage-inducible domain protein [Campylobacter pinnipediorum subsp. pinnipediorum]|uniref:CinA family protein n=1 Tax=Campylobacter pinnipediorum TaxID=1965231 RepID=UPI00084D3B7A|nr:CinA family protein [Campylobacter pinnipediorum]AQW82031.1 competence/damage-inducible domain protein [Campylobacter pinnipediorum subsp. pinnipediorum]AQW85227.1 competence/damage-inducible domain protein [Campylobacter pinnipediorum subsp. pinnipediorum]OPA74395.1 competence protein [Campylobacter pinnipediorum subsp. pinnipediorum]